MNQRRTRDFLERMCWSWARDPQLLVSGSGGLQMDRAASDRQCVQYAASASRRRTWISEVLCCPHRQSQAA